MELHLIEVKIRRSIIIIPIAVYIKILVSQCLV